MKIIITERLKELITAHGLTQTKLAEKLGLKQNTISSWSSIASLWLLADYFETDIDYFVGRKND